MYKKATIYETGLLGIWVIVAAISLCWAVWSSCYEAFSRAGSILVICAVASEYSHFKVQVNQIKASTAGAGAVGGWSDLY